MSPMFNVSKRTGFLEINLGTGSVIPETIAQFADVQGVVIENSFVSDLSNLNLLQNLNTVQFWNCNWIDFPKGLSNIENLKSIAFFECTEILSIDFGNIYNLENLSISDCYNLIKLENIEKSLNIKELSICFCSKIDLTPLNNLKNLKYFKFWNCGSINFTLLRDLVMNGCFFSADLNDWASITPELDLNSAIVSVFVDNDKQFMDIIDSEIVNRLLFEKIKNISDHS